MIITSHIISHTANHIYSKLPFYVFRNYVEKRTLKISSSNKIIKPSYNPYKHQTINLQMAE